MKSVREFTRRSESSRDGRKFPGTGTVLAVALVLSGFPTAAHASDGTRATLPDPVLDRLVAEGLERNPDVLQAKAEVDAAGARVAPARTWPDPFATLAYQNDGVRPSLGTNEGSFLGTMLAQTVPWPGKLRFAGQIARQEADAVTVGGLGRTRLSVESRIRRNYYAFALARQQLLLIEERGETWRQVEAVVRERYATAAASQQDLFRTQVEILRLDEERAMQRATLLSRAAELNRAVGRAQDVPVDSVRDLPEDGPIPELPDLLAAVGRRSPELAATQAAIKVGDLRVRLARRDYFPDLVVGGGPMFRGPMDPMWQLSLGFSLPIHFRARQRSRLEEARASARSSQAAEQGVNQELEFRTRERLERLHAAAKVARLYRDGILVTDRNAVDAALASYRTGRVPFVTVLEALNVMYADRSAYLERLAEVAALRVAVDEASLAADAGMSGRPAGASMPRATASESANPMNSMR